MGKHFKTFKRCVSMVLTVAMLLSICNLSLVMSVTAAGGGMSESTKFTTLGSIMAENYDLSAAEELIISSGDLLDEELVYYEAPPAQSDDENKLIVIDEDNKKITVKSFKDSHGNTWIPETFDLVANGGIAAGHDDLGLTKDGDSYVGNYTYDDNTFSVDVKYVLDSDNLKTPSITVESQLAMLNAAAKLAEDIDFMEMLDKDICSSLYGTNVTAVGVLSGLTTKLPQLDNGTVIDLIYSLVAGVEETVTLPDGSTEEISIKLRGDAKDAATALYNQQQAGGLDLVKFLNANSAKSYLELVDLYGADLETALDKNYAEIGALAADNGLPNVSSQIQNLLWDIDDWTDDAYDYINAQLTANGMTGNVDSVDDIEALLADAKAGYAEALAGINAQLAYYSSYVGNVTVEKSSDLDAVIETLKAKKTALFGEVNSQISANATILGMLGIPTTPVNDEAALANLISAMENHQFASMASTQIEGLKKAQTAINTINTAITALTDAQVALAKAETAIALLEDAIKALNEIEAKKAELSETKAMVDMLAGVLEDFCDTVKPVVDRFDGDEWNAGNVIADNVTGDGYADLTANATGVTKTYAEGDVIKNLEVDTASVQYNLSMFNVTIKVNASVVCDKEDCADLVALKEFTKTITLRKDAPSAEILAEVNALVNEALAAWGEIDGANYVRTNTDLPEDYKLDSNIIYKVDFAPKTITVTYGDGFDTDSAEYPYGYQLTLPKHETDGMAYSYIVDGTRMNQGKVVELVKDITISRSAGAADQYKTVTDLILNTDVVSNAIESFLQSPAINKGQQFWLVVPEDGSLINQDKLFVDGTISAETVESELGDLVWVPVTAITYDEDGNEIETVTFNGTVAEITDPSYSTIKVKYDLKLTVASLASVNVTMEEVLAKMNLQDTLSRQYIEQKAALEELLTQRGRMALISQYSGALSTIPGVGEEAKAAINKVLAQLAEVKAATGEENLKLYYLLTLCDTNLDGEVDNMAAYYQHDEEIIAEVEFMLELVDVIKNDSSLWGMIGGMGYTQTFEELEAKFKDIELIPAHDDIITDDTVALENLVSKIAAASEKVEDGVSAPYDPTDLENLVWSATVQTAGKGSVTIPITLTVDGIGTLNDSIVLKAGQPVSAANIAAVEAKLAALEEKFAEIYGAIDKKHYDSETVLLVLNAPATGDEKVSVKWTAKTYTVIIDGVGTYDITYANPTVTLPGSGNVNVRYDYSYTYGDNTITQKVSTQDQTYTFNKAEFDAIFASGSVTITRKVIDAARENLIAFFDKMEGSAILTENNGKYAAVLPVTLNTAQLKKDVANFAMAMFMSGYSYIGIDGQTFYGADAEGTNYYYVQALVDAILDSGVGTQTVIDLIDADGKINQLVLDGYNVIGAYDKAELGGKLIKTTMSFGTTAEDAIDVDFYITLSDTVDALAKLRAALVKAAPYASVVCEDGKVNAVVNLPDQVYAAYLAALTMVGEVDLHDVDSVNAQVALGYIVTLLDPILSDDEVTLETITNTIDKFNYNLDLSAYEKIYATVMKYYDSSKVEYTNDTCILPVEDININSVLAKLQGMVDGMVGSMGMEPGSINLSDLVYEAKTGCGLDIKLALTLNNVEKDYAALVIDAQAAGVANKVAMLTSDELVAKAPKLSGVSAVILLGTVEGDLNFNTKTLLDLNGCTVNGNISASNTLIITDNVLDNASSGSVTGTVSGSATVIAGKYASDVSAFLKSGYVQNADGLVYNKFYTISATGNDVTVTLNATVADMKEFASKNSLIAIAIDAGIDVLLNYYNTASLSVEGCELYDIQIEDIVDLVAGTDRVNNAIDKAITAVSISGFADLFNTIVADLTDFDALAKALEGDGVVAEYSLVTAPWNLEFEYVESDDSLTVNLGAKADKTEGSLTVVITGELKDDMATVAGALADTVTVDSYLDLDELIRNDKDIVINGSYNGSVVLDFTHDRTYVVMMAVILADNSADDLKAELVAAIEDYYTTNSLMMLEEVFNNLSVKVVCDALANVQRTDKFTDMVNALALSDDVKTKINGAIGNDAKGYARVIEVMGIVLRALDSRDLLESVTESGRKLGGIAKTDADGRYYGFSAGKEFNLNREVIKGYGVDATIDITNIEFKLRLFGEPADHEFTAEFDWAEDYSACKVILTCGTCVNGHVVELDADVEKTVVDADCENDGTITYTATATYLGKTYTDTKTVVEPATKHSYTATFNWADDYSVCSVALTCACGDTVTLDANVTFVYTAPSCVADGSTVYTATITYLGKTYTDTKTVVEPATKHSYTATFNWADDYSACEVVLVCDKCASDTAGHTVVLQAVVTWIEEDDYINYYATVTYEGVEYTDHKRVAIVNDLPVIAVPSVKDSDKLYGFKADPLEKIIYLDAVADGITALELKDLLSATVVANDADNKVEVEINGTVSENGQELVPTGATITLIAENVAGTKVSVTYSVVVIGDVNGNGRVENNDAVLMRMHYMSVKELVDTLALAAADTNRNGRIDNNDAVRNTVKYTYPDQYTTCLD